jgi:hypothetical protein
MELQSLADSTRALTKSSFSANPVVEIPLKNSFKNNNWVIADAETNLTKTKS